MDEKSIFFEKMTEMTGKKEPEIRKIYLDSKLEKHSDIRTLFMNQLGLSYGYANTLAHYVMKTDGVSLAEGKTMNQVLDEIYSGEKMKFRVIHDTIMKEIEKFGGFEIVPKKGYVSLKQKRQFAMIGPKTNSRMEVGINIKKSIQNPQFEEQPKGSMCQYLVKISQISELNNDLFKYLKVAYEESK